MRILLLAVLVTTARAHLGGSHRSPDEERHSQLQNSNPGLGPAVAVSLRSASSTASLGGPSSPAGGEAPASSCPEFCTFDYKPICGTDGVTYTNECTFSKAACRNQALQQNYVGPCVPLLDLNTTDVGNAGSEDPVVAPTSHCSERCQRIFQPVCGSDGLTYNNPCVLQFADCKSQEAGGRGISVAREGSCEDGGLATQEESMPIPDFTGSPVQVSPAPSSSSICSERCTRIFTPVCGSDGQPYNNLCLLQVADCRSRETGGNGVDVAHEGSCGDSQGAQRPEGTGVSDVASVGVTKTTSPCKRECIRTFLPVCGSDGNGYNNQCLLDLASCESVQAGGNAIFAVSDGLCVPQDTHQAEGTGNADDMDVGGVTSTQAPTSACLAACNKNYLPVCGSDGNTYSNRCELDVASCKSVEAGGDVISFVADGVCGVSQDTKGQDAMGVGETTPAPTSPCRPECPKIYLPVCGSDGNSYNNKCLLDLASCESVQAGGSRITIVSEGLCGTQEPETTVSPQVVGVGGDATRAPASTCQTACTRDFLPVCGSNGNSYNNQCLLDIASCESLQAGGGPISVVSEGFCAPAVTSPPDVAPVTEEEGSKGTSSCRQKCTKTFLPVCGSDGNTYDNECILNLASCRRREEGGRGLYVATTGPCGTSTDGQGATDDGQYMSCRKCSDVYRPVCGSDRRTYDNECILDNNNCKAWQVGKRGIYIVKHGPCGDDKPTAPSSLLAEASGTSPLLSSLGVSTRSSSCPDQCTQDYAPVCGTDNLTYDNKCVLLSASCRRRSLGEADITIAFDGPCVAALPRGPVCDTGCDKSMSPVCGSDGVTYGNPCLLSVADCLNPFISITRVSDGPCGTL